MLFQPITIVAGDRATVPDESDEQAGGRTAGQSRVVETGPCFNAGSSHRYAALMCRPDTGAGAAVASERCLWTSRRRRRRRRCRQIDPRGPRSALLLAVLLIAASHGIVLRNRAPVRGRSVADSRPPHALGPGRRKRFSERERDLSPRRCANVNGGDGDLTGVGPRLNGAAGSAVHTLLIDNYDSYTYNLFQLLAVVNGRAPFVAYNDDDGGNLW